MTGKGGQRDGVPTNIRLLLLLEQVASAGEPITATEANRTLGLPKATVHRLFATLEGAGFLERAMDGRGFAPGARLRRMATGVMSSRRIRTARTAILGALAREIGETCNIATPGTSAMVYLDRVETQWPLRIQLPVGTEVPFTCTASGKMYLSTLSEAHVSRLVSATGFAARTERSITDRVSLASELARIRDCGYSCDDEEFITGMIALAVPVREGNGRLLSTLSFHAPEQRMSLDRAITYAPRLQQAARALGELLEDAPEV